MNTTSNTLLRDHIAGIARGNHAAGRSGPGWTLGRQWRIWPMALLLPLLAVWCGGCQTSPPQLKGGVEQRDPGTASYATNVLQEGDTISITFESFTNFSAIQKITLDGMLNLKSVNPLKAAGKTPEQLQAELAGVYKSQAEGDVITVKLVAATTSVYISGAVYRPGKVLLERPMTVLEAIMEAGGYDPDKAKLSDVAVLRIESGRQRRYPVDLKQVLDGDETRPFYLRPFDIVHVPQKKFNW
jgi:polysaccharide export outer membrane protein